MPWKSARCSHWPAAPSGLSGDSRIRIVCRLTAYDCHIDTFCTRSTDCTRKAGVSVRMKVATTFAFSGPSGSVKNCVAIGSRWGSHSGGGLSASDALSPPPSSSCSARSCPAVATSVSSSRSQPALVE